MSRIHRAQANTTQERTDGLAPPPAHCLLGRKQEKKPAAAESLQIFLTATARSVH
jgi:hypothetical protein